MTELNTQASTTETTIGPKRKMERRQKSKRDSDTSIKKRQSAPKTSIEEIVKKPKVGNVKSEALKQVAEDCAAVLHRTKSPKFTREKSVDFLLSINAIKTRSKTKSKRDLNLRSSCNESRSKK